ncbi:MATE family efflux transporter [Marispirochaeta aestuarii]|uniref:MATE family efflux transporter n=1 Tax=Marispirochaeta aestuarii TaxID=1963862 RepID=UPI0029C6B2B1|nr:MATE family efflux transporter [Marispirochaeta aestuarii]
MKKINEETTARENILRGNLWSVLVRISFPLVVFSLLNHVFKIFDTIIASSVGSLEVSAVIFVHQIKFVFDSMSLGLAAGGSIVVARHFGAYDDEQAGRSAGNLIFISLSMALVLVLLILFNNPILGMSRTPPELMPTARGFLTVELLTSALSCINMVFIGIERAKGHSRLIMILNLMVMLIKLGLSCVFVYLLKTGVIMLAISSLIAQAFMLSIAFRRMRAPENPLRITRATLKPRVADLKPLLALSLPIMVERFAFSFGKLWMNALSAFYGGLAVGALGISNQVSGTVIITSNGVMDGNTTIIAQNLGNQSHRRALSSFYRTLVINIAIGAAGFIIVGLLMDPLGRLFGAGDPVFIGKIKTILSYERWAFVSLTLSSALFSLFYGFGMAKVILVINVLRLFLFRLPPLIILRDYLDLGYESIGMTMLLSNLLTGISALAAVFIFRKRFWPSPAGDRKKYKEAAKG